MSPRDTSSWVMVTKSGVVVRQVGFFAKDLDLSLSDPFKDVKDGILLDENELAAKEEAADEEQEAEEYGDDA